MLTAGNEEVDALAKATAKALSSKLVVKFQPYLERAVAVQAHLIATLVSRTNACQLAPFDEDDKPPAGLIQTFVCTCKPRRRLVTKSPRICYKSCHLHGHTILVGDVESRILQSYKSHVLPPDALFELLRRRYLSSSRAFSLKAFFSQVGKGFVLPLFAHVRDLFPWRLPKLLPAS